MPFYLPNGMMVVNEIERVVREQLLRRDYQEIRTPHILDVELWKRSGPLGQLPREHVLHAVR